MFVCQPGLLEVAEFNLDFSLADPVERNSDGVTLLGLHALLDLVLGDKGHTRIIHGCDAPEDVFSLDDVDLDHAATCAVPMPRFGQRASDAGRGHFEVIGTAVVVGIVVKDIGQPTGHIGDRVKLTPPVSSWGRSTTT